MMKTTSFYKLHALFLIITLGACSPNEQKPKTLVIKDKMPARVVFSSELEKMNYLHPVDWKRFGNSIEVLMLERYHDKNCVKLQQQYDDFSKPKVYKNYERATGKAPRDVLDWLEHAMYAVGCYKGQSSPHSKE